MALDPSVGVCVCVGYCRLPSDVIVSGGMFGITYNRQLFCEGIGHFLTTDLHCIVLVVQYFFREVNGKALVPLKLNSK